MEFHKVSRLEGSGEQGDVAVRHSNRRERSERLRGSAIRFLACVLETKSLGHGLLSTYIPNDNGSRCPLHTGLQILTESNVLEEELKEHV